MMALAHWLRYPNIGDSNMEWFVASHRPRGRFPWWYRDTRRAFCVYFKRLVGGILEHITAHWRRDSAPGWWHEHYAGKFGRGTVEDESTRNNTVKVLDDFW